jgi:DNA mismatch repair ATPase MutS
VLLQSMQSSQKEKKGIFLKIQSFFSTVLDSKLRFETTNPLQYRLAKEAHGDLRQTQFLHSLLELRGNPVFWLFLHVLFPFDALVSLLWMQKFKSVERHFATWFEACVEWDVACALARVHAENPESHFTLEGNSEAFQAQQLGHPLLSFEKRVCNDFSLSPEAPVVVLTGSNMAGKSTFLRTLGLNLVLRAMGGPVFARSFHAPHVGLHCAIRVNDELESGRSYFFAEVSRLAGILTNLSAKSLVLVDEIYRGTNNKERFIGSWSMLLELASRGVFALVSTHDLALAQLPFKDSRLRNMHFREHIEGGELCFDYQLKEGPCPTTNALFIMKKAGLPVKDEALAAMDVSM